MAHQCVHCKRIIPVGSRELLEGCNNCGNHFFFYIRDEKLEQIKENPIEIPKQEKKKVEQDIRDIAGITRTDVPVVLDLESIRVTGEGKFEIDIANLFKKERPLIYKLEDGKYIIDLGSTLEKGSQVKEDKYKNNH